MFKRIAIGVVVALMLTASTSALAASGTPRVDAREHRQQRRIRQGVRSGELSAREVLRLEKQQVHIRRYEARAKSDGTVTAAERARLHHKLNHSSRSIRRQKHD
jgi:hypothetical protein